MQFRLLGSLFLIAFHLSEHNVLSRPAIKLVEEPSSITEAKGCCGGCTHHHADLKENLSSGSADVKDIDTSRPPPANAGSSPQQNVLLPHNHDLHHDSSHDHDHDHDHHDHDHHDHDHHDHDHHVNGAVSTSNGLHSTASQSHGCKGHSHGGCGGHSHHQGPQYYTLEKHIGKKFKEWWNGAKTQLGYLGGWLRRRFQNPNNHDGQKGAVPASSGLKAEPAQKVDSHGCSAHNHGCSGHSHGGGGIPQWCKTLWTGTKNRMSAFRSWLGRLWSGGKKEDKMKPQ